MSLVL